MATTGVLTFEGWPGEEFRVRLSPVPLGAYLDFAERWGEASTFAKFRDELAEFERLAAPTWTVAGVERFVDLDMALVKAIVNGWLRVVGEVPPPLPAGSSGTERSPEPSTPTPAAASRSRRSSATRNSSMGSSEPTPATP